MIAQHKELGALSAFLSLDMSPLSVYAYQGQILSRHLCDDIYFIPVLYRRLLSIDIILPNLG